MKIGQLAARSGVSIQTIRFYERRGLLREPPRRSSGYREFGQSAVREIRFIRIAQELGYTLGEIRELLDLKAQAAPDVVQMRALVTAKLRSIDERIRALQQMRRELRGMVKDCECGTKHQPHCMVLSEIERLAQHD
jgi:MerR family copper efflux transcriptional regulator